MTAGAPRSLYIVTEFCPGGSLGNVLEADSATPYQYYKWALEICDALRYLHDRDRPIVHLDVKPQNEADAVAAPH